MEFLLGLAMGMVAMIVVKGMRDDYLDNRGDHIARIEGKSYVISQKGDDWVIEDFSGTN